ncbi:MAG TPA: protein kinase [Thermoanaerobaculia bacterium]|nr:protein kinase [Thermoanaerobaculia bacterium]
MAPVERQRNSPIAASELTRSDPFPPGTTIARYRLVSFIGSGAMGDVYRAHDRALDREVALKVLPPELTGDRERVHRFAQEARSASALSHPHIVSIHEVGHARPVVSVQPIGERPSRAGEVHYISMELVDGDTLREVLATAQPLRRKLEILTQVADGLSKAHAAGIVHRDLKPDNILVARDGYAKIVDFGLAKLIDTTWNPIGADSPTLRALTAHGELLGTPGYMAPEQVTGKALDARADIFSFGCILYEAIGGSRAFEAETFVDTLYKIVHDDPAPLDDAPPELQRIIEKCLARDRDQRYQSIRDAANDLRQWNAGLAPPEPAVSRRSVKLIAISALVASLPILAFLFLPTPNRQPQEQTFRRLTTDGRASSAALSPDGRYAAYVSSDAKGRTLILEQIATGTTLTLAPASDAHYAGLAFSRDGEYLYFTRYDRDVIAVLYRISILGGEPKAIVRDIDTRPAIAPDGSRIAFVRDDFNKGTSVVFVVNADGTNERPLATFRIPDKVWSPAWSPDGESVAVAHRSKLLVIGFPKGTIRAIETRPHFDGLGGVAWPERKRLVIGAMSDDAGGRYRLWNVDPASGEATAITSDLVDLHGPSFSDDGTLAALQVIRQANLFEVDEKGRVQQLTSGIGASNGSSGVAWMGDRVVYTSAADGKQDLWTMSAGTHETTRLTDDTAYEMTPLVAPNGSVILYAVSADNQHTIWRMNADGSDRRRLTPGPRDADFAISPDSKQLAFASVDPKTQQWGLWTMPVAGGTPRRVATRGSVLKEITYTGDGKSILFTGYENSMLRLYRVPASGGAVVPVIAGRAHTASMSPDGTTIALSYDSVDPMHAPLALVPANGGKPVMHKLDGTMYRWHPNGRAITFVREENGRMDLWLQPLDGTAPRRLTQFSEGSIVDYAWSTNGKRAVVAHTITAADVVLMK